MARVEHKNLVKLLAVCMTYEPILVTELMPLGCLLNYVRNNKNKIGSKSFIKWSTQIAKGKNSKNKLHHQNGVFQSTAFVRRYGVFRRKPTGTQGLGSP